MQDTANARLALPQWELLPDIGLYMDQVITLTERTLGSAMPQGALTKSMVNNYVKAGLIKRPDGKKYGREHLALLLIIAVLKQALSMEDIAALLGRLCADGVQAGYACFARQVEQLERAIDEGWQETGMSAQDRAVTMGVAAAVCTIRARLLLGGM